MTVVDLEVDDPQASRASARLTRPEQTNARVLAEFVLPAAPAA